MWFTIKPADDLQLRVGAGIARPVAASAATYLGVPLGTQDFKAQAVRSNAEQPVIANLRNLPGEQCSPLHAHAPARFLQRAESYASTLEAISDPRSPQVLPRSASG